LTGLEGFGSAYGGAASEARFAAEPLAAIQVKQNHRMAELGVARNRPGAAAFRVARVTARNDYLEVVRGGSRQKGQRGGGSEQPAA
jgi:hypothetical protein